jgi:mannose-6-phosphate isomerase-like protein (cupin superfamily)
MDIKNLKEADDWFSVLQTSGQSQTAVMRLAPGQSSGDKPEAHEHSEQILLVLEGELLAEIEGESQMMKKFDLVVIPPGKKHKFTNQSRNPVLTFNTYSPPEY